MNTKILIVEDEGLIALDLKKKLEQVGYIVSAMVDNSEDAIRSVERLQPSLVLMDIRLRGPQDGVETADQIRRRFRVPVMFVTAHADRETLDRARITEPFGYIVKPFHGIDFRAQIEMALWKHKMEQKLRVSEAWLSTTFRNVADALIATDSEGNIAFMNTPAAELTGWDSKEAEGQPFLDVFQVFEEKTNLPVIHPIEALYDGHEVITGPRTFNLRKRGCSDSILVEAKLSANRDDGSLLGIIVVFRDITERRRGEEQSIKLQKLSSLATMAIGLGSELEQAQNRLDASLTHLIADARLQGYSLFVHDVAKQSAQQQSIVQQLIRLGRTDAGQAGIVDLNAILTKLEPKFRKVLSIRRHLELKLEPGIPPIKADLQDLQENLFRLVVNARHALPDEGTVEISTRGIQSADGKHSVHVAIRDTGKGIRINAKERIFDPYYQSRPGNRNPGFSLALVYQFVALSGGSIEVENAPGEGVTYLLSFPAADDSYMPPKIDDGRLTASA